uniref:Uncharacterized protein n=1 Tax=Arion vulgaris TaxID=1028688 RepID=A0A0B7B3E9_9EUPU
MHTCMLCQVWLQLCSFQAEEVGQTFENVSSTICPQTRQVMTGQEWNQLIIPLAASIIVNIILILAIVVPHCKKKIKYSLPQLVAADQGGGPVGQGVCCVNLQQRPAEEQEGNKVSPLRQRSFDGVHKRVSRDPSTADNFGHRGTDVYVHHPLLRDIDDPLTNQQPHNNTNVNGAGSCRCTQRNSETSLCSSSTSATDISDSGNASGASSNPDFVNQEIWDCQDPRENQSILPVRQTATISEFE